MTIQEYFGDWSALIDLTEAERLYHKVSNMQALCGNLLSSPICPLPKDIYRAFHLCPLHSLKVIIAGQDPYPNLRKATMPCVSAQVLLPVATGLAFANEPTTPPHLLSPSLTILRDSVIDFTIPHGILNFDPSLEKWERQGVLLLNTALTCQTGKPGSHALLWRPFITQLLTNLSTSMTGIVYILMGSAAQSFEHCINPKMNHIIRIRHPSWYARNQAHMPHELWQQVNTILQGLYGQGIQWYEEGTVCCD